MSHDPCFWREKAAWLRKTAQAATDLVQRETLLMLAGNCEALAVEAERRRRPQGSRRELGA